MVAAGEPPAETCTDHGDLKRPPEFSTERNAKRNGVVAWATRRSPPASAILKPRAFDDDEADTSRDDGPRELGRGVRAAAAGGPLVVFERDPE